MKIADLHPFNLTSIGHICFITQFRESNSSEIILVFWLFIKNPLYYMYNFAPVILRLPTSNLNVTPMNHHLIHVMSSVIWKLMPDLCIHSCVPVLCTKNRRLTSIIDLLLWYKSVLQQMYHRLERHDRHNLTNLTCVSVSGY